MFVVQWKRRQLNRKVLNNKWTTIPSWRGINYVAVNYIAQCDGNISSDCGKLSLNKCWFFSAGMVPITTQINNQISWWDNRRKLNKIFYQCLAKLILQKYEPAKSVLYHQIFFAFLIECFGYICNASKLMFTIMIIICKQNLYKLYSMATMDFFLFLIIRFTFHLKILYSCY